MTLNYKFGKPNGNGGIEFATLPLVIEGVNVWTNVESKYNALGYYEVIYADLPEKEGYYYTSYYEIENNKILQKWKEYQKSTEEESYEADTVILENIEQ